MTIPDMLKNAPMFKRIDPKHKVGNPAQLLLDLPMEKYELGIWRSARWMRMCPGAAEQKVSNGRWRSRTCCRSTRQCQKGCSIARYLWPFGVSYMRRQALRHMHEA